MEEDESRPPLAGLIVLFIGAAFIVVGVCFLTFGLYSLIRTGIWPHYPFSKMLTEIGLPAAQLPDAGAGGWLLAQSACVVLLTIGAGVSGLGAWLIARFNRRRRLAAAAEAAA
jgi:hypothetical protein